MSDQATEDFLETAYEYYLDEGYPKDLAAEFAYQDLMAAEPDWSGAHDYEFGR